LRFLKYFKQLFENITNFNRVDDWEIVYNHYQGHDLNDKIKRTDLNENKFNLLLSKIIFDINKNLLNGDYIFISFKYNSKIVTNIDLNSKLILIVTILGKNENIKDPNNTNIHII
jgi:hypothetical protein